MAEIRNLYKTDASTGVHSIVYPITSEEAVFNPDTGKSIKIEIDEINEKIGEITLDENCIEFCNSVKNAIDGNDIVFLHFSDTHVGRFEMPASRARKHARLALEIAKACRCDFICHTGDVIQGNGNVQNLPDKECYENFIPDIVNSNVPFIFCLGSPAHDLGQTDSTNTESGSTLTRGQVFSIAGRYKKWFSNAVYNTNDDIRSYYYFDIPQNDTRVIILDSCDLNDTQGRRRGLGFSSTQNTWLTSVLSDAKNKNYKVLFFSHMITNKNLRWGADVTPNGDVIETTIKNFVDNGGVVLGMFYGHEHWDNYYYYSSLKMPTFCVVCDMPCKENMTNSVKAAWGTSKVWDRTVGTTSEYAYNVFVINPYTRKIQKFRYGCGENEVHEYTD